MSSDEKAHELKNKLLAIKSCIVGTAPQKNKNRRIMSLADMALEIVADIEKEMEAINGA
jgi:hypothetical protein